MSMEKNLNNFIEELIQEIEQELDEATTTASVDGYNTPFAFGSGRKKDKKKKDDIVKSATGYTRVDEGLVSPKRGHEYFQLTKDTPVKYIAGHSGLGLTSPGVLLKNIPGFIDGKKGSYLIDYHGALFYVDLKKKVAVRLGYDLSKQPKLRYKTNFIEVPQAPDFSDWKKYLKESVNEAKIPQPIQNLIDDMVKNKIQRRSVRIKSKSGLARFMKDVKPALKDKLLTVKHNPIDKDELFISLGPKAQNMKESVNEAKVKRPVNRWLELKNDETMHPHKKMAMGLKELKYQLRETEKFFNWYNKIKTMNELDSNQYWKRTNSHIYKIKERLINIARTIQEIEK